ncbi:hypothetical protein Rsub_03757 [Raphidocelis subcapitata]|uniref:S-adenosyl-L-methionine-dependent methyltransferase n=1 Tax=Raphidocelis subcapitata TaxID=307507 RepID=A0A2V0NW39_9CHLO|nr:hypothetical protein Rsub_03757 [Raphidocelis subcapitata]|eukprot:GBF90902.1 hypothetical protein Rsub_03757 [Raphidocelis subcapitata]
MAPLLAALRRRSAACAAGEQAALLAALACAPPSSPSEGASSASTATCWESDSGSSYASIPAEFYALCQSGASREWGNLHTRVFRALTAPLLRLLIWLAMKQSVPTNCSMLLMRVANQVFNAPNANKDWVARRFLRLVLPSEHAHMTAATPTLYARFRFALFELPGVGIPGILNFLDGRTQWFDDRVTAALDAGVTQVVVIAAGFDSTAYRLGRPGVTFFEVDLPKASARKRALLGAALPGATAPARGAGAGKAAAAAAALATAAGARVEFVAADLATSPLAEALASSSSFDPSRPALFTAQGLLYYLPPRAVAGLLAGVRGIAAPGSRLAFDFMRLDCLSGRRLTGGLEVMRLGVAARGEPFLSALDDAPGCVEALGRSFGFRAVERFGARQLAARFLPHLRFREFPAPVQPCFAFAEFAVDGGEQ